MTERSSVVAALIAAVAVSLFAGCASVSSSSNALPFADRAMRVERASSTIRFDRFKRLRAFPRIRGVEGSIMLPPALTGAGTKAVLTLSKGGVLVPDRLVRSHPEITASSPVVAVTLTSQGAATLLTTPGLTVSLDQPPAGNVVFFMSIFDPSDPYTSWFVGPGVLTGKIVSFAPGGSGSPLTFTGGHSYVFQIYAVPTTAPTPTPIPSPPGMTQFALPVGGFPTTIVTGPDGNEWFAFCSTSSSTGNQIGRISPYGLLKTFAISNSTGSIVAGPDGNMWAGVGGGIDRITPAGNVTSFSFGNNSSSDNSYCCGVLASGPDGNLWAASDVANVGPDLFVVNTSGHVLRSISYPGQYYSPTSITAGPEGSMWLTALGAWQGDDSMLARVTADGTVTEFPLSIERAGQITAGQDGNLWFADCSDGNIERATPQGEVTSFFAMADSGISRMTTAPDGTFWFVEWGAIGHMDEKGNLLGQYVIPPTLAPYAIAVAPDGSVWITEWTQTPPLSGYIAVLRPNVSGSRMGKRRH